MKAILVFDVDKHTYEAMIDEYFTGDITLHLGCDECIDFKDVVLKPMPEKVEMPKIIKEQIDGWHKLAGEYIGYNACIDELLGGEE